jgi:mRNA interferase ChpB
VKRGEIWIVNLDPVAGSEQAGRRPVLIISPDEFNRRVGTPLVVPITSGGGFARSAGFAVTLMGCGTTTAGVIRCDQLRTLDLQARGGRRVETAPEALVQEVLARLQTLLE